MSRDDEVVAVREPASHQVVSGSAEMPTVANVNINKSSGVQIGPKFVTVTQNVSNAVMVRGKCICIKYGGAGGRQLGSAAVVFCACCLLAATGLVVYFVFITLPHQRERLDLGLSAEWYVRRADWQAMPAAGLDFRDDPVHYVIVGHSALNYCQLRHECIHEVQAIQKDHLQREFNDIGANFLVGGNGYVFEGRGANIEPSMVTAWNTRSVMIMFIGNYQQQTTDDLQFEHLNILLDELFKERVLSINYVLYGHCQVQSQYISPGRNVMAELNRLAHWSDSNVTACPFRG